MLQFVLLGAAAGFLIGFIACPIPDVFTALLYGIGGAILGAPIGLAAHYLVQNRGDEGR